MAKVLFSDNEYPDVRLERDLFGAAGIEVVVAQCKTEDEVIEAARDCAGILLQYAPITERVVAGAATRRHREPDRRGFRHRRHRGLRASTGSGSRTRPTTASAKSRRTRWRWRSR